MKRIMALLLALVMVVSTLPGSAIAEELEPAEEIEEITVPETEPMIPEEETVIPEETETEPVENEPEESVETEPQETIPDEAEEETLPEETPEETEAAENAPTEATPEETEAASEPEAEEPPEETEEEPEAIEKGIVDSGTCGDNLTWELDDKGTLTISGSGKMDYYNEISFAPWYSKCNAIKAVIILDGITNIGSCAFYDCSSLTSVTIPDSVTEIGWSAFENCTAVEKLYISSLKSWVNVTLESGSNPLGSSEKSTQVYSGETLLKSLNIPEGSTAIQDYAFYNWNGITSVSISDGVASIGRCAFYDCSSLSRITIPESVTSIGFCAFSNCSAVEKLYISSLESWMNVSLKTDSNPLSTSKKRTKVYVDKTLLTNLVIPAGITEIQDYAFYEWNCITSVTIPEGVTRIGESAFYDCISLTSVTIPDSVTSIDYYAFLGCIAVENLYISSLESWMNIKLVDGSSPLVESLYHDKQGKIYVGGKLLTDLVIPAGITEISSNTFLNWSCVTSVTIPDGVTRIGDFAFEHCLNLKTIKIPDSVTTIDPGAFWLCPKLTNVTIPANVDTISDSTFGYCHSLTNITISDNITSIGNFSFLACTGLVTVTIGENVTSIGNSAFEDCEKLRQITFLGDVPSFEMRNKWDTECTHFYRVTATAYYPCSNPTWTEDVMQDYGGKLTWVKHHRYEGNACADCGERYGLESLSGPETIRGGSSAVYKAKTTEKLTVLWKLRPQDQAFAAVSSSGKLTTKPVAAATEIMLTAYLKNNTQVSMDYPVQLLPSAEEIEIQCKDHTIRDGIISLDMNESTTVKLTAGILPEDAFQTGTWKSSSAKIATVNSDGTVTFLKSGTVKITFTASDGSKKNASVKIIGGTPAQGLEILGANNLVSGQKTTLTATFKALPTVNTVTWQSSDPTVAAVSSKGIVTAKTVYEDTPVTITAKATDGSGEEDSIEITVSPKPGVLEIRDENGNLVNGKTLARDSANNKVILSVPEGTTLTSSKPKIAIVSGNTVTFLNSGTTVITAKNTDGTSGKVTIKMSTLVKELSIQPGDDLVLTSGKRKLPLKAIVNPNASLKAVTWSSSNPAVATVSSSGVVKAKAGILKDTEVTITATAKDGSGITESVTVTVVPKTTVLNIFSMGMTTYDGLDLYDGEVLNGRTLTFRVGKEIQLGAIAYPYRETAHANQAITWKSSSAKIAAVTPDGTVTASKAGTVTITAKTADGKSTAVKLKFV